MYIHIYVYTYTYIYVYVCVYIYIYIYIYIAPRVLRVLWLRAIGGTLVCILGGRRRVAEGRFPHCGDSRSVLLQGQTYCKPDNRSFRISARHISTIPENPVKGIPGN